MEKLDMSNEEYQKWLEKLENYCAYQERCISEVKTKMYSLKIPSHHYPSLIESLIDNQFLDEERYVRAFMRSKVSFKKDGLEKIRFGLMKKGIKDSIIKQVFEELDQEMYQSNLSILLEKKWNTLILMNEKQEAKAKLIRFLLGKGYKYDEFKGLLK
jgi:regulatory protein